MENYISAVRVCVCELMVRAIITDKICFKVNDNRIKEGQYIMPGEKEIGSNIIHEYRY